MAPMAELLRPDGTVAKSKSFFGDVKVVNTEIFVNTEGGHEALTSIGGDPEDTLRLTEDAAGGVFEKHILVHSVNVPLHESIVIHHDTHAQSQPALV